MRRVAVVCAALPLLGGAANPSPPVYPDWAVALRRDARAFHHLIAANHPGPVNRLDPGFRALNDRALALTLARATRVRGYAGYRYALDGYAAAFDDGHLATWGVPDEARPPKLAALWGGLLATYGDGGRYRVALAAPDAGVPVGAVLVGCDGVTADRFAASRLGAFRGRWMLASQRARSAGELFLDSGNPFVRRAAACTWDWAGRRHTVAVRWRVPTPADFARFLQVDGRTRGPIGEQAFADGTRWFTLSGFDSDPSGGDARALVPLIAAMRAERAALAAAPRIVLDLRGNNGGSSDWSRQIAGVLWGKAAVARAEATDDFVEWRVSPANLATLREYRDRFAASADTSAEVNAWASRAYAGMAAAQAEGLALWREPSDAPLAPAPELAPPPFRGRILIVTDRGCASACLDAVDLWRALGAVQVGQETSADTLYMDVRQGTLPSGWTRYAIPMKVYRGRARGDNVPWRPHHPYPGDLQDTAALERWAARLPTP